jgi:O-antigen/teichoic acid export membrane protein
VTDFSSNVFKVLRGSLLAQAIALAALPLLSRLYEPAVFGAVQAMLSVLAVLLVASSLRLEIAVLNVEENQLPSLVACSFWLCVMTSAIAVAGVVIWSTGSHYAQSQFRSVAFVLPVMVLLAAWVQLLTYLSLRHQQFALGAKAKVAQAVGAAGSGLTMGVLVPGTVSLALADVIGRLAQGWALLYGLRYQIGSPWRFPPASVWLYELRRHKNLWRISLPSALINTAASAYTPVLVLLAFDASVAGIYAVVERILATPVALIVGASSQVFMSSHPL